MHWLLANTLVNSRRVWDYAAFSQSALVRSAVERQLEIIGEALNKAVSQDVALSFSVPEIPRIIGLRNRLIHGYDVVDDELVWDVVQSKIIPLRQVLQRLLAGATGDHGGSMSAG